MYRSDPYTPQHRYYECCDCLERTVTDDPAGDCPECGGRLQNLAVPRE